MAGLGYTVYLVSAARQGARLIGSKLVVVRSTYGEISTIAPNPLLCSLTDISPVCSIGAFCKKPYAGFTLAPRSPRSPRSRKIVELHDFVFLPRFRTLPYASNKFCHDLWRFITNPTRLWSRSTTNFSTIRQAFSRSSRWTLAFSHVLLRSLETCHVCYVLLRSATIMETIQRGSPRLSHDWHIKRT